MIQPTTGETAMLTGTTKVQPRRGGSATLTRVLRASLWLGAIAVAATFGLGNARADDYQIGYITDLSGPLANSYTPTWQGFDLYMKALNDRGGINGRKVKVFLDDDGLRADRSVAAAKKQVEENHVLGIFGLSLSSTQAPVMVEMRKAGIPVASTFSAILDALPPAKPDYYSTGVTFEEAGEAIAELSQRIVPKGLVVGVTFDSVGGRAAILHNKLEAEKLGYTWGEVVFPVRTSDYTAIGQSIAAMKPAIVVGHYGAEQNLGVIAALGAAGYKGPYVIASYGASEATAMQAAEQAGSGVNIYIVSRYVPMSDPIPAVKEIKAAADKYGVANPSMMHVTGWVLGKFAAEALAKCGADCDSKKLDEAMQHLTVKTDGLTGGDITMTPTNHYGPSDWRLYHWDGKNLVAVGGWLRKDALAFPAQ
jgi:branched-chain amino acid transport system substrate-binding protein